MLSSHFSCDLPTGLLPWNFPSSIFFWYSRSAHLDYMTGQLQSSELKIFHYISST
jgi:hypothetical protein